MLWRGVGEAGGRSAQFKSDGMLTETSLDRMSQEHVTEGTIRRGGRDSTSWSAGPDYIAKPGNSLTIMPTF